MLKKLLPFLSVFLIAGASGASDIVAFDEGADPQRVTAYRKSVHTPDWLGRSNVLINPQLSAVDGVPRKFWKVVGNSVVEWTQAEKDAQTSADATASELATREGAKLMLVGFDSHALLERAMNAVMVDYLNAIHAVPNVALPPLTIEGVTADIDAKVDGGTVDD